MGVIKDLPLNARPREKAILLGLDNLSNEELLAIIISSGYKGENALDISKRLLNENINLTNLSHLNIKQLTKYRGVKEITALKIGATFTLANRLANEAQISLNESEITDEIIAKKFALEMTNLTQEKLMIILLNKKKRMISKRIITIGNSENASIDISLILKELFAPSVYYFYLLHNHPSGSYNISTEDIIFTHRLNDIAKRYKRYLIDHLIFNENGCYSMGKSKYIN